MDEVTQQNSALVEENAATAKTLEHQAKAMDERVAFFRIAVGAGEAWSAQPTRQPVAAADTAAARVSASKPAAVARSAGRVSAPKPVAVVAKAGRGPGNGRAKEAAGQWRACRSNAGGDRRGDDRSGVERVLDGRQSS